MKKYGTPASDTVVAIVLVVFTLLALVIVGRTLL